MNAAMSDYPREHQIPTVIGIDMGLREIHSAILRGGHVLSRGVQSVQGSDNGPDVIIPLIQKVIDDVLTKHTMKLEEIAGIGIGVPGLVDLDAQKIVKLPNIHGWVDIKLADRLKVLFKHTGRVSPPIVLGNDANAIALGLHHSTRINNMVFLTVSTGIGAGIIVDGKVLTGSKGSAGELGHMIIRVGGKVCRGCNNHGCLEAYASGKAIAQQAERERAKLGIGDDEPDDPSNIVKLVVNAYHARNPGAQRILTDAFEALGDGIVNIANTFNPERIFLGGFVTNLIGDLIVESANTRLRKCALPATSEVTIVKEIRRREEIAILGAGALATDYVNRSLKKT